MRITLLILLFIVITNDVAKAQKKLNRAKTKSSIKSSITNHDTLVICEELIIVDAEFKDGGEEGMLAFISKNLKLPTGISYPEKIKVHYMVDTNGFVSQAKLNTNANKEFELEILRVFRQLKFKPALQNGKPKEQWYLLPLHICLD